MTALERIPKDAYAIWGKQHDLANFGEVQVSLHAGADVFQTSEQLYQMTKFLPSQWEIRAAIQATTNPSDAKKIAREHKNQIRSDWQEIQYRVMEGVIRLKLKQNEEVLQELLDTEDRYIYEDADQYAPENPTEEVIIGLRRWGIYNGEGQNWIGEILMELREEFRNKS